MKTFAILSVLTAIATQSAGQGPLQCASGDLFCCKGVFNGTLPGTITSLLPPTIPTEPASPVGINCTSIPVADETEDECTDNLLCCSGQNFGNGTIVLDCEPIGSPVEE